MVGIVLAIVDRTRDRLTGAARWVLITAAGGVLVCAGIVMLFTPGPGLAAIALGLWLWAKQFQWARRILDRMTATLEERRDRLPAFVGRILDERSRRRHIQDMATKLADAEIDIESDRPGAADTGTIDLGEIYDGDEPSRLDQSA